VTKDLVDEWLALDDSSGRRLSVLGVSILIYLNEANPAAIQSAFRKDS
jgi:hypothetical protein